MLADSSAARLLARALGDDGFVLVDVGCSGGIDHGWRVFGGALTAYGFDPAVEEIARLQRAEKRPGVHYVAGFVSAGDQITPGQLDRDPTSRLSAHRIATKRAIAQSATTDASLMAENRWTEAMLADRAEPVILGDFFEKHGLSRVDFLKIDCDGPDFDILRSLDGRYLDLGILGAMLEVNFIGSDGPDQNSFHNTDRFMRAHGFDLFGLSVRLYSAAALPFPGRGARHYGGLSIGGRPYQGDALYVRDLAALEAEPTPAEVLRTAAIFALFGLDDHAGELLLRFRHLLEGRIDIELALRRLVEEMQRRHLPLLGGRPMMSHEEYQAAFDREDDYFFDADQRLRDAPLRKLDAAEAVVRAQAARIADLERQLVKAEEPVGADTPNSTGNRRWFRRER